MSAPRRARIAEQIQRELAELIRLEVRDPRVGMVTLTGVEMSGDQSHAKVFFTVLGQP
jgi:ribosome-binding factor A